MTYQFAGNRRLSPRVTNALIVAGALFMAPVMFAGEASGCTLGPSRTLTTRPLPPLKVTVTVAGALGVFCELVAMYWKVTVADAVAPTGGAEGFAVNEPSAFIVTVPPLTLEATIAAVSVCPCGSVSLANTPGAPIWNCDAMLLT